MRHFIWAFGTPIWAFEYFSTWDIFCAFENLKYSSVWAFEHLICALGIFEHLRIYLCIYLRIVVFEHLSNGTHLSSCLSICAFVHFRIGEIWGIWAFGVFMCTVPTPFTCTFCVFIAVASFASLFSFWLCSFLCSLGCTALTWLDLQAVHKMLESTADLCRSF